MSIDDGTDQSTPDERLRWALRDLRRDVLPERDLWPRIAAGIASKAPVVRTSRRFAPWALAASLLLAIGVAWQLRPLPPAQPTGHLIQDEALAMTREYNAALLEVQASTPEPVATSRAEQPAMRELDRSAAQIRTALARDPGARFLLERLRHTYSLRLALTRRTALG